MRKMSWQAPHALEVLASPEHGFFFWTPLAALAIAGLVVLALRGPANVRRIGWCALLMVALQIYVSGSVESWTVAGAFGQRRFVALTILLTIGLAGLLAAVPRGRWRPALARRSPLCVWWNVALIVEFGTGLMNRQRLELRKNAYDAFVTLPRRAPGLAYRYFIDRDSFYRQRQRRHGDREASSTSPTSGFRSSGPTASRRWRRAMRWRAAATTVHLVVRPDTHTPPRDPFEYYGLPKTARLVVERAPVAGPHLARRLGYLAFAAGRAVGAGRADIVMTRDLAVASLLLRLPLPARPPLVVRIARLRAGGLGSAARPRLDARRRRPPRSSPAWRSESPTCGSTPTATSLSPTASRRRSRRDSEPAPGSPSSPTARGSADGRASAAAGLAASASGPVTVAYAGHLYAWKGVDVLLEAIARVPDVRGLDRRRTRRGTGPRSAASAARLAWASRAG